MSTLKNRMYAESPYDLGSDEDNKFRDMIDEKLTAHFVVEVEGGVVTAVHGLDDDEGYSVIDWDNIKAGEALEE